MRTHKKAWASDRRKWNKKERYITRAIKRGQPRKLWEYVSLPLSAANVSQPSVTQNTDVYSSRPSDFPNKYSEAIDGYFILTEI
jgi:hypothetical protein